MFGYGAFGEYAFAEIAVTNTPAPDDSTTSRLLFIPADARSTTIEAVPDYCMVAETRLNTIDIDIRSSYRVMENTVMTIDNDDRVVSLASEIRITNVNTDERVRYPVEDRLSLAVAENRIDFITYAVVYSVPKED